MFCPNFQNGMGYCSKGGHGVVTPSIGDEGIDGIIYQDRLGLDV